MIEFLATEPHFADHLRPIWAALPAALRGAWHTDKPGPGGLTVVASYGDLKRAREHGRRVVLAEHGAGQSYVGTTCGSYIGAPDRAGVVAVLVPGENAAARHAAAHPTIPAYAIGIPKLDERHRAPTKPRASDPVVAISFHWECRVVPETRSAWYAYRDALPKLAREFPGLIGHAHPRLMGSVARHYDRFGLDVVHDFAEVMDRADVYCVDNSSTLFEFASLDRPVVVLNAPIYRRNIDHGLRFWEAADIGVQVDRREYLADAIRDALDDPPARRDRRAEIVRDVYGPTDGKATARAVRALKKIHAEWGGSA